MMHRRTFLCGLTLGTLIAPIAGEAQQAEKMYRIGFLGPAAERVYTDSLCGLRVGLAERGYVEGKNIAFESRFAEDKFERLPGLAAELVRNKVDIIVVHSTPGTRAAKQATSTIPIVMASSGDLLGQDSLLASAIREAM
jgi:putative tryptophan/tyrosine transport system substrate-binding protein